MLETLEHPQDRVVIVATVPDPLKTKDLKGYSTHILTCMFPEHYICRWWNAGLDYIAGIAQKRHEVLALSSDHQGKSYSVAMLGVYLRQRNLTMVGPNPWTNQPQIFRGNGPRHAQGRVPGNCWMLAGESGLRVDENFRWWYSDDDLEMQARQLNGTGILPDTGLVSEPDTPLNDEKEEWAKQDRIKFVSKWGIEPW